jgi:prophage antirepressor-like protein
MDKVEIFKSAEFGTVRTVTIGNEPWFVGKDVAEILGYSNTNKAIQVHVDDEDKFIRSARGSEIGKLFSSLKEMQEKLGRQDNWFISESGVYSLVFSSKLPTAKKFKRWVTSEVLPAIRKHGAYMTEDTIKKALQEPDFIIKLATELKEEKEARKTAHCHLLSRLHRRANMLKQLCN